MSQVQMKESKVGSVIVVELSGKFMEDGSKALADLIGGKQLSDRIVFDCSEATYGNSSFIGAFVRRHRQRLEQNGKIVLCCVTSEALRERIEISQLDKIIEIFETRDLAVTSLAQ